MRRREILFQFWLFARSSISTLFSTRTAFFCSTRGAGELLLVIEAATEEGEVTPPSERLCLPAQADPLAVLFRSDGMNDLAAPDAAAAAAAAPTDRRLALQSARDEIRRVLLGYDVNAERGESLLAFLEVPLPDSLPGDFLRALAQLRRELPLFVDIDIVWRRDVRRELLGHASAHPDASIIAQQNWPMLELNPGFSWYRSSAATGTYIEQVAGQGGR